MAEKYELKIDGLSGSVTIEKDMAALLVDLFETFKKKQACYGKGNIAKFGEIGTLVRAYDKIERLYNLVFKKAENKLPEETINDTWLDLADYALIALLVRSGAWERIE
ncbi:MAG: hypothetical protein JW908_04300 [Anaerolineales bacterium]|nr:hypothetical protein [Anaerolineales bacterium]